MASFSNQTRVYVLATSLLFLTGAITLNSHPAALAAFLALLGGLLLARPYLQSRDLFHPFAFLGLTYLMQIAGPVIDFATIPARQRARYLLDNPLTYLLEPLLVVLLAVACLTIGYRLTLGQRLAAATPTPPQQWNQQRARTVIRAYTALGLAGLMVFIATTDLPSTFAELSHKRAAPTVYIRYIAYLLLTAAFLAVGTHFHRDRPLLSLPAYPVTILVGLAALFPIYTSNRGVLLWLLVGLLVLYHYTRRQISLPTAAAVGVGGLFTASLLGAIRKANNAGADVDLVSYLTPASALDVVFGADYGGITALSHVVQRTPGDLAFRYGETFLTWIVLPIPRAVWPGKPVNLSSYYATHLYGMPNGMPGTLISELYLNYWLVGVVVGMLALGVLVRAVYAYLQQSGYRLPAVLLYAVFNIYFLRVLFSADVSKAVITAVLQAGPLVLAVLYISGASPLAVVRRARRDGAGEPLLVRAAAESRTVMGADRLGQTIMGFLESEKWDAAVENSKFVAAVRNSKVIGLIRRLAPTGA